MASADKELEEQLLEAGNKLVDPPSSVDELLPLLDRTESCLSRVEQSPPKSMLNALSPLLKALTADKLLRHSDVDVKVAVASCASEITRITAPDAPYDDDKMKDVFQLIVSSFENLYDMTSRSYSKRTMILETVAKVRSCVVMLDLECDALILEMFQHFLNEIREHHPENVFSSIETIMTLVIDESEDISMELLSPILASVKKGNEEVSPIARKLGERVLESCATKLKPYIVQAVNTLNISLDNYSDVLASVCQDMAGSLEQNDACAISETAQDESKSAEEPQEESAQVVRMDANEAVTPPQKDPQQDNAVDDRSSKSVMSNGIALAGKDDALVDSISLKKQEDTDCSVQSKGTTLSGDEVPNDLGAEKVDRSEQKLRQSTKRSRRKRSSSVKSAEPTGSSHLADEKEAERMVDSKIPSNDLPSSHEDDCVEAAAPSENDKEDDAKLSSLKEDVASPLPRKSLLDENRSKKVGRGKKKDSSGKDLAAEDTKKHPAKKVEESKKGGVGGSTSRQSEDKKKRARGKVNSESGVAKSSTKDEDKDKRGRGKVNTESGAKSSTNDEDKEMVSSPKTATKSTKDEQSQEIQKANSKRKRTPGKETVSDTKIYDENLVGTRVKVWWPDDEMFYEGIVDYFDSAKKRHKVSYDDGDEEVLNLKEEIWEIIDVEARSDGEEGIDRRSPDASLDIPPKKKGKTSAGESKKEGKRDASSKSGAATSSKSKGASIKSGQKSKDGKADRKSKDSSKTVGKSEDEGSKKSKDHTPKSGGGKSTDAAQKVTSKLKNTDSSKKRKSTDDDDEDSKLETLKTGKSKQVTSKTASASKAKSAKSGGKSNGTGKVKSNLLKVNDSDSEDNSSDDSTKEVEDTKGKSSISSKAGSESKSGKKRGRN